MSGIPSPGYSITIRVEIENRIGMFARIASALSDVGGDLGAVDIVRFEKGKIIRDITVNARDEEHEKDIARAIKAVEGVRVRRVMDRTYSAHQGGKIEIRNKMPLRDRDDLSRVYTPGVARVCRDIQKNTSNVYRYTVKGNSVAIVSDGSAVLGLGDIGPEAALPVMEGKAMIFKEFAGIDAYPLILDTKDPEEIIETVRHVSPTFGGINLEDISAPRCFIIETTLRRELNIPVFHDDQHGTAIVILAALINVGRLYRKEIRDFNIVIAGAGAAGSATAWMLHDYGVRNILVCDRAGILYEGRRERMNDHKLNLARMLNPGRVTGILSHALKNADVVIGLSGPDIIAPDDLHRMARDPVVFALANPDPEIAPEVALPLVRILATGRSDYPNQINNMLCFPGLFRGLLDVKAQGMNRDIELAAALSIARIITDDELHEDYIIPSIFDRKVVSSVSRSVSETARKTGLARE